MTQVKEKLVILSSSDKTMSSTSEEYSAVPSFTFHVLPFTEGESELAGSRMLKMTVQQGRNE
jgi:hypothetical protein